MTAPQHWSKTAGSSLRLKRSGSHAKKHDASFPRTAQFPIASKKGTPVSSEVDHVVFYDKPFLKFERLLETYVALAPRGFRSFQMAIPLWLREKLFQKKPAGRELRKLFRRGST